MIDSVPKTKMKTLRKEEQMLITSIISLSLNDPQNSLNKKKKKNNTIAMQQYGKVSLRNHMKKLK